MAAYRRNFLHRGLEERLGVRLLDRTTRRARMTEAGQAFYVRRRRLIEGAEAARAEAQTLQKAPAERLRIAAPEGFAKRYVWRGFLPRILG